MRMKFRVPLSPLLKPHFPGNAINHFCVPANHRTRMSGQFFHRFVLRAVVLGFDLAQIIMAVDATKPGDSLQGVRCDLRLQGNQHIMVRQLNGRVFSPIFSKKLMGEAWNPFKSDKPISGKTGFPPSSQKSADRATRNVLVAVLDIVRCRRFMPWPMNNDPIDRLDVPSDIRRNVSWISVVRPSDNGLAATFVSSNCLRAEPSEGLYMTKLQGWRNHPL